MTIVKFRRYGDVVLMTLLCAWGGASARAAPGPSRRPPPEPAPQAATQAPAQPVSDGERRQQAERLRQGAIAAWDGGDYLAALDGFEKANRLYPSVNLRFNIARVLSDLGRDVEALEAFERFLAEAKNAPEGARGVARAKVEVLSQRVARLELKCLEPGAELRLDGQLLGIGPLERTVRVNPGPHQIAAEAKGLVPFVQAINPQAGQTLAPKIVLARPAKARPVYKKAWFWVTISGIAVAVAGATLAGIYARPQDPETTLGRGAVELPTP